MEEQQLTFNRSSNYYFTDFQFSKLSILGYLFHQSIHLTYTDSPIECQLQICDHTSLPIKIKQWSLTVL